MSKNTLYTGIAVTVTLVVVGVFFILGVPFSTSSLGGNQAAVGAAEQQLMVQEEAVGTGSAAKPGDLITINYTGTFEDGTVFDTSVGKEPITFVLGAGQIIPGLEQGLVGAQAGSKRMLVIPPSLAYGPNDYGPIPGNSTLIFQIEVVSVQSAPQQ